MNGEDFCSCTKSNGIPVLQDSISWAVVTFSCSLFRPRSFVQGPAYSLSRRHFYSRFPILVLLHFIITCILLQSCLHQQLLAMGLHLSSAWSTPRGWRLITVTLIALTLLLVIPLHRLSDDSPGVYSHLTKYLSHEGAAYDVEEGFVANINETTNEQILNDEEPAQAPSREPAQEPTQEPAQEPPQQPVEEIFYDTDSPQYTGEKDKETPKNPEKPVGTQQPQGDKRPNNDDDGVVLEVDRGTQNEIPPNEQIHSEAPKETSKPESIENAPQVGQTSDNKPPEGIDKPQQIENKFHDGDDKRPDAIKVPELAQNNNNQENENGSGATGTKALEVSLTTSVAGEFTPSQTAELEVPSGPLSNWTGVCEGFPNTDGIMLVMKTGATEAFTKLPAHLLTSLQCLDDYLLFSDLVSNQSRLSRERDTRGRFAPLAEFFKPQFHH